MTFLDQTLILYDEALFEEYGGYFPKLPVIYLSLFISLRLLWHFFLVSNVIQVPEALPGPGRDGIVDARTVQVACVAALILLALLPISELIAELADLSQMVQLSLDLFELRLFIALLFRWPRRLRLLSYLVKITRLGEDLVPVVGMPGSPYAPRHLDFCFCHLELFQSICSKSLKLKLLKLAILELLLELFHHAEVLSVVLTDLHQTK